MGSRRIVGVSVFMLLSMGWKAQAGPCPETLSSATMQYGQFRNGTAELAVSRFLAEATSELLRQSDVRVKTEPMPYSRVLVSAEAGAVSVLMLSDSAMARIQANFVSVPLMRLPVVQYSIAANSRPALSRKVALLRGFTLREDLMVPEPELQRVNSYDSLFGMLAAGRVASAIAVRPGADIHLKSHPKEASLVGPPLLLETQTMSVHFAKTLPPACLQALSEAARNKGGDIVRAAVASLGIKWAAPMWSRCAWL